MKKRFYGIFPALFYLILFFHPAFAAPVYDAHTQVDLISENVSVAAGKPFWVAVRMKMDPGWHVYWRNPGDSGLAPKITWQLPAGFSAGEIRWPYPKRIDAESLTTYGYADEVLFLAEIIPSSQITESGTTLKAHADWLACEVPCVPGKANLTLSLPVSREGEMRDALLQRYFDAARVKLPKKDSGWVVESSEDAHNVYLYFPSVLIQGAEKIEFFPFEENVIVHSAVQNLVVGPEGKFAALSLKKDRRNPTADFKNIKGIFVISQKDHAPFAIEINATPQPVSVVEVPGTSPLASAQGAPMQKTVAPLGLMLFFAFLGGMLLNLMPCVFPVLSIKVLTFVNHSHGREALWEAVLGFALGVIAAFTALAGFLIILREGGQALGWGFQFQSSYFVAGMSLFLFIVALNFFGVFELNAAVASAAPALSSDYWRFSGTFLSGVLAVIVATPCTAPFMGTAMSFALTQSNSTNVLIFMFLGIGMALPFSVLCLSPALVAMLPKPGAWMENFKKFLGFPLLLTVLWLLWVLAGQREAETVLAVLSGMFFVAFGFWLRNLCVKKSIIAAAGRILGILILLAGITAPFCFMAATGGSKTASAPRVAEGEWIPYDAAFISQKEAEGKIIFIDFTARWCLTCQVNEKISLNHPDVVRKFKDMGVVLVKADWTNRDAAITKALAEFGKNSVPVYVMIYTSEGRRQVMILPELLTPGIVIKSLEKVKSLTQ